MTASEAIQNYVQLHSRVFSVESESKAHRSQALDSEIRSIIEQKLGADGDKTLLSGFKSNKTLVIAMQRVNMSLPVCFRTYRVRSNVFLNPTIAQAAAATIADPRLFDPVFLGPPANEFVHANDSFGNPIEQLLHEAQSTFPGRYISCIISIGARHFGLRSLILPTEKDELAAHALAIGCQRTADALEHKFSGFDSLYFRFNIDQGLQAPLIPLTLSQVVTHVRAHVRTATMNRAIQLVTQAIIERPHICSLDALK
ncbi:hypothetical protein DL96DRAFT_261847 [Flagelloscypha sp. PMI_526]|nr:hypothetical protein DL96DRAFT_261847 [Flagelloscypha sp. PMI_526]